MTAKKVHKRLRKAQANGSLINLRRRFESWRTEGFVVASSENWVLIHQVYDACLIGWVAFRLDGITKVWEDKTCTAKGLKKRGVFPISPPEVETSDSVAILGTVHRRFPLVNVHTEDLYASSCWIGRVDELSRKKVNLVIISPQAKWNSQDNYRIKDITRIEFGGNYESLLWEMGSENAPEAFVFKND
jgi:hypothetical protein